MGSTQMSKNYIGGLWMTKDEETTLIKTDKIRIVAMGLSRETG